MKQIILVRHATAVAHSAADDDFGRVLRKRGRKEARAVAQWCDTCLDPPDLLLSSPADRALETAEIFAKTMRLRRRVITDRRIYDASGPPDLIEVLHSVKDTFDRVMVFGHNPVFGEFAAVMAPPFAQPLPKCGVVVIDTRRRRWSTLQSGDGRVSVFQHPEALKTARKQTRQSPAEPLGSSDESRAS